MTSEEQKAANQANARHSTGPKTPKGKAVVRLNALRHGLLTRDIVLPGEDADAFEELWNRVRAEYSPVGPTEELLVDRIVNAMWRLRRLARAETALFHWRVYELKWGLLADEFDFGVVPFGSASFLARTQKRKEVLQEAKYQRDRDEVLLGRALDADAKEGDTFGKLIRY